MSHFSSWVRERLGSPNLHPLGAHWQYALHVFAVYCIAWYCVEWLAWGIHERILPLLLGRSPEVGSWQFLFSHLLVLSIVCGLLGGLVNAKLFSHPIVRFVWVVPVIVLVYAFLFSAPGMYPTMPFDSDYRQAFDYYFGGHFSFPKSFHGRKEFVTAILLNPDFNRAYHQFRITIPAYVGVAYSVGACFSVYANRLLRVSNAANEVTP